MTSPIVALHTVEPMPRPEHFRASNATTAARFDCSTARLGPQFGFSKLGCNITAVAPGKAGGGVSPAPSRWAGK